MFPHWEEFVVFVCDGVKHLYFYVCAGLMFYGCLTRCLLVFFLKMINRALL